MTYFDHFDYERDINQTKFNTLSPTDLNINTEKKEKSCLNRVPDQEDRVSCQKRKHSN